MAASTTPAAPLRNELKKANGGYTLGVGCVVSKTAATATIEELRDELKKANGGYTLGVGCVVARSA